MSSYNELIALINGCINRNGVQAITGRVLNGVLRAMVNQLGAGYAMGGVAHPTDDPGTPDAPVCYYASEVGTYTHFGNIQIVPGELALLCFDLTDGWFKETMYEGFESVQATIDGNVGTPAVNVTYVNGVLSFDFSNMKGNTGAAAGFGNVTAAVDGTIGTPGVSVQTDGPDTAKNIAFQFTGLKGETGVTSVIATVDNTSGTPQCAVSLNGQQLTLAFTGLKGAQGDTGSSVAYPFTIVNNLTTNDATQALSAAMGVQLESEVSQLEAKVDDLSTGKYYGYYATASDLPEDVAVDGFAYVGSGPTYTIYNCEGGVWTSSGITVNQSPIGNDEDIDQNEDGKLQFANRTYNAQQPNGMGYKILRKNATFASQVTGTNTIYEIRDAFDLGGQTITIPAGSVLKFAGGSLSHGGIDVSKADISADAVQIFASDLSVTSPKRGFPEWFGAVANKSDATGNRAKIQKCVDSFGFTILLGMYYLNDADSNGVGISLANGKGMMGASGVANAVNNPTTGLVSASASIQKMIVLDSANILENFVMIGLNDSYDTTDNSIAIYCNSGKGRFVLKNLDITHFRYGLQMKCWMGLFDSVFCHSVCGGFCFNKGSSGEMMTSLTLRNCYTYGFTEFCFYFDHVVYSTLISCAADTERYDLVDDNNYFGAYFFEGCVNIKMIRCGNEDTAGCVYLLDSGNIDVDIYRAGIFNQTYSSRFEKSIRTNRTKDCNVSVRSVWVDLPESFTYAYLNGRSDYGHNVFHDIPFDRIAVYAGGTTPGAEAERYIDLDIKGGVIETENVSYNKTRNHNWLFPVLYNYSFTNNGTYYTTAVEWYDDYHNKTLKIEASSYGGTYFSLDGSKPKEFRGFKQVIFKNLIITDAITGAGFTGDCIFKFIGCGDVVFENCYFRTKRPSISAYINADCPVKLVNCAMICTDASPNESLSFSDGIVLSKISSTTLISMTGSSSDAGKRKYLPEGTKIVFSDGTFATNIGNTVQAHAEVIVPSGGQVSDLFSTLSAAEKALLVGSCATDGANRYFYNGSTWVNMDGTAL